MAPDGLFTDPWLRLACGLGLGLVAGSFLATLVVRWPAGRSVAVGRSRCDGCDRSLGPIELVPVLSFAVQRGRCRHCGASIDPLHPALEVLAAAIGGGALFAYPGWDGLYGALAGWLLLTLAALDLLHLWLPDRLTALLVAIGLLAAATTGRPAPLASLIGAGCGWASLTMVAAVYRRLRGRVGLGGGDPKLFAGIGAWLGWQPLPLVMLVACGIGGGAALVLRSRGRAVTGATQLPFGTLLAVAAWPVWLAGFQA